MSFGDKFILNEKLYILLKKLNVFAFLYFDGKFAHFGGMIAHSVNALCGEKLRKKFGLWGKMTNMSYESKK